MIELLLITGAIMLLSMVKKPQMPLFGQLTLTGELALDWVKNPTEIIASKIWFCNVNALSNWNVPEWAKDKGIVALIFPVDEWGNPLFVTQKSILKILEFNCAKWAAVLRQSLVMAKDRREMKTLLDDFLFTRDLILETA